MACGLTCQQSVAAARRPALGCPTLSRPPLSLRRQERGLRDIRRQQCNRGVATLPARQQLCCASAAEGGREDGGPPPPPPPPPSLPALHPFHTPHHSPFSQADGLGWTGSLLYGNVKMLQIHRAWLLRQLSASQWGSYASGAHHLILRLANCCTTDRLSRAQRPATPVRQQRRCRSRAPPRRCTWVCCSVDGTSSTFGSTCESLSPPAH